MTLPLLLLSVIISSIIMTIYYFSVFSQDSLKEYSNLKWSIFVIQFIILFIVTTVIFYLFLKMIINSKQIYPRIGSGIKFRGPSMKLEDLYFNKNFNNLFKKRIPRGVPPPIKYFENQFRRVRAPQNPPYIFWD